MHRPRRYTIIAWLFFLCSFLQLMSHRRYWNLPHCESRDLFSCEANKNICTCLFSHLRTSGSFEIHSIPECYWMHFSHRAHPHPSITKIILIALRLQFVHAKRENEKLSTEWIKVKFLNYNNECTAFLVKSLSSAPLSKAKGLWRVL